MSGAGTVYIEPGSPWENPYVQPFNGLVHDELFNVEEFGSLLEVPGSRRILAQGVQRLPAAVDLTA